MRVWAYNSVAEVLSTEKLGKKRVVGLLELAQLDAVIAFRSDTGCKHCRSGSDDVQSPDRWRSSPHAQGLRSW